jgi:predicted amidohydrolase
MDDLRVAAVCMRSGVGKVDENLARMEGLVAEASARGADMVCFPELSVTGYSLGRTAGLSVGAEAVEKTREKMVEMARKSRLILLAGVIEPSGPGRKPFISHMVVGPEGVMGCYRKTHLSPNEKEFYRAGDTLMVFSSPKCTFAVQLCYEAHFPEISTIMSLQGADILFIPHASPRGGPKKKLKSWMRHLPGRAFDNGVFVVACNQVGKSEEGFSFPGVAVVLGPDGGVLSEYAGNEEAILLAEVRSDTLEEVRRHRMKYFLPQRRPALFGKISEP